MLKRRIRMDHPGAPELLGLGLLLTILVGSIISFVSYLNSPVPIVSAKAATSEIPLTEEGLRRILQGSQMAFGYSEESGPAGVIDRATNGFLTGSDSMAPIVLSRGDGVITMSLGEAPSRAVPSQVWSMASPFGFRSESVFGSWFAVTLLTYVATLIYFTTIYPSWRRGGQRPSLPIRDNSGPAAGRLF